MLSAFISDSSPWHRGEAHSQGLGVSLSGILPGQWQVPAVLTGSFTQSELYNRHNDNRHNDKHVGHSDSAGS